MGDDYILGLGPNQGVDTMAVSGSAPVSAGSLAPGGGAASAMSTAAPFMMAMGAINSAIGAYYQSSTLKYQMQSQQSNLEFASKMSEINARNAERSAQSLLLQGERQIGQVTMRAGKIRSSQKASQAARGISLGYGSTAEEIATTDLMKETDAITISANATQAAWAARTQAVNYSNQALMQGVSADNMGRMSNAVSPWMSATSSLVSSGGTVASSWYNNYKTERYLAALQK